MYKIFLALIIITSLFLTGCETYRSGNPEAVLTHPLGTDLIKVGMAKDEVMDVWGEPDMVNALDATGQGFLETAQEEWIYKARYGNVPLNAGYLSKDRYLYFDGNNLVRWEEGQ